MAICLETKHLDVYYGDFKVRRGCKYDDRNPNGNFPDWAVWVW